MYNVHFNGEIVHCPDHKAVHLRAEQIRDQHRICKYGYLESTCERFISQVREKKCSGRCPLACSSDCPGAQRRRKLGSMKKQFKIDHAAYRKIASAAHYLIKTSPYKVLFLTLTFPKFRKKHRLTKSIFENEILNTYFSKFVENLRENYDCKGYVAVREHGETNTYRTHYHIAVSLPYVDLRTLNSSWNNTIQSICFPSRNALQSDPKNRVIRSIVVAVRYMCKYFSKCRGQESNSRLVFISRNLIKPPERFDGRLEDILTGFDSVEYYETSEYSGVFRVRDEKELKKLFITFIYKLFNVENKAENNSLTVRAP